MVSATTGARGGVGLVLACTGAVMVAAMTGAAAVNPWEGQVELTEVRALGGPNAVHPKPLVSTADLQAFFVAERATLTRVLEIAGWTGHPGDLFAAVAAGAVEERPLPVGVRLPWMASMRGGTRIHVLRNVVWQGREPFAGFVIRFVSAGYRWAFVVPKACGNLALWSRTGTDELTVVLTAGTLELTDPEGNPILIRGGEIGKVSATLSDRYAGREVGEVDVPTTVTVAEGTVEFSEYKRPVSVLVTGGNEVTATMSSRGQVELAVPPGNTSDIPVRIGDAYGYLKGGIDMAVAWPAPVCRLELRSVSGCAPGEVVVDARATSVEKDQIAAVAVEAVLPDGSRVALGAPTKPGEYLWQQRFDQVGSYRFEAEARSVHGLAAVTCSAALALPSCLPPLPACDLDLDLTGVEAYDTIAVDASASVTPGSAIERVEVTVVKRNGQPATSLTLTEPWVGELELAAAGTYWLRAEAVDSYGRRSDPYRAKLEVGANNVFSIAGVVGYGASPVDGTNDAVSGWLGGVRGSFDQRFTKSAEVALALGLLYDDGHSRELVHLDVAVDWLTDWGFLGAGVGLWDLTHGDNRDLDLILRGGTDVGWKVRGEPVVVFAEGRLVVEELDNVDDAYRFLAGIRLRPW